MTSFDKLAALWEVAAKAKSMLKCMELINGGNDRCVNASWHECENHRSIHEMREALYKLEPKPCCEYEKYKTMAKDGSVAKLCDYHFKHITCVEPPKPEPRCICESQKAFEKEFAALGGPLTFSPLDCPVHPPRDEVEEKIRQIMATTVYGIPLSDMDKDKFPFTGKGFMDRLRDLVALARKK